MLVCGSPFDKLAPLFLGKMQFMRRYTKRELRSAGKHSHLQEPLTEGGLVARCGERRQADDTVAIDVDQSTGLVCEGGLFGELLAPATGHS